MSLRKKQMWGIVCAVSLMLGLLIPAFAQQGPPPPPNVGAQGLAGRITAVSSTSITVTPRNADPKTYSISSTTTITINRQASTADKLTVGQFAAVTSSDGTTATAIDARNRRQPPNVGTAGAFGRITAVSSTSITVQGRDGTAKTFTIAAGATIKLDDQTSTVDKLAVDQFAAVTSNDGTTTSAIDVHTRPGPPPGGGPGGPPPGGGPGGQGGPPPGGGPGGGGPGGPPGQ